MRTREKLSEHLTVRLTQSEQVELDQLADAEGRSRGAVVRLLIREAARLRERRARQSRQAILG